MSTSPYYKAKLDSYSNATDISDLNLSAESSSDAEPLVDETNSVFPNNLGQLLL